jgi:hypothetical protein
MDSTTGRTRARRSLGLLLTVLALAGTMLAAGTASAATTATMAADPLVDLVNGSVIQVTGTGYTAGELVVIITCNDHGGCGNPLVFALTSSSLARSYTVSKTPTPANCNIESCFLVVHRLNNAGDASPLPLWFRNTGGSVANRAITATPSTDLAASQTITASGHDFYSGWTPVRECITTPVIACTAATVTTADAAGAFAVNVSVQRTFTATIYTPSGTTGTMTVDCTDPSIAPDGCRLTADQGIAFSPSWTYAGTPLTFLRIATSRADCARGGWQHAVDSSERRFKNEGDCVSSVATGGRNGGAG